MGGVREVGEALREREHREGESSGEREGMG